MHVRQILKLGLAHFSETDPPGVSGSLQEDYGSAPSSYCPLNQQEDARHQSIMQIWSIMQMSLSDTKTSAEVTKKPQMSDGMKVGQMDHRIV